MKNIKWLNRDNIEEYVRDYSDYKLNVMYDIFDFLDSNYKKKIIL